MVDVYESLTIALIAVLAAASTVAIFVGLLGMAGQFFRRPVCRLSPSDGLVGQPSTPIVSALSPSRAAASAACCSPPESSRQPCACGQRREYRRRAQRNRFAAIISQNG